MRCKKTKKVVIMLAMIMIMIIGILPFKPTTTFAQSNNDFEIDGNGCLMSYNGTGGKITIPNGVKIIGENAFSGNNTIFSIKMPSSVTKIERGAFDSCSSLKEITFSKKLSMIGDSSFWGCTSLKTVSIPDSVKKIGIGAFGNCDNLKSIYIPKTVKEIGNYAFGFVYYGDYVPVIDFVLMGENKTVAKTYADKYNIKFITKSSLKTTLSSVSKKNSNKIKIKWKKNINTSGYEIQYSSNKHFTSTKCINIKSNNKTSYTLNTKKKNGYIRIRGYRIVGGIKYYSAWSKVKKF